MDFATRYDLLKTAITRYDGYFHLSAVKASLLLTTNVILLAALVNEESGLQAILARGGGASWLLLAAGLASLVSMCFAVLVIASYLARSRHRPDHPSVMFSSSVAAASAADYVERVVSCGEDAVVEDLARLAHDLAGGLNRKFRRINRSLLAFLIAILAAAAAFATAWIGG